MGRRRPILLRPAPEASRAPRHLPSSLSRYDGLPVSQALSMGVHESQSLLWERMVFQARTGREWNRVEWSER